jgi:hypothetical protein
MMLVSFIFVLQDFLFLRHSGKLLGNTGRRWCKPNPCLLILDMSSLKYSPRHQQRARSQVSTQPLRTTWLSHSSEEGKVAVSLGIRSRANTGLTGSHLGPQFTSSQAKNPWHEMQKNPICRESTGPLTQPVWTNLHFGIQSLAVYRPTTP